MKAEFHPQGLPASTHELKKWTYWRGPIGSHVLERRDGLGGTIRMTAGVGDGDGIGSAFIDYIDFTFDREVFILPQPGVTKISADTIRVGAGADMFALQGTWTLDYFYKEPMNGEQFVLAPPQLTRVCKIGKVEVPLSPSLINGKEGAKLRIALATGKKTDNVWEDAFGFWMPYEASQPGIGGLHLIQPIYGYEQDYLTHFLMHRMNRQRSFYECRHASSGAPMRNVVTGMLGYNMERMPQMNSTLPLFWVADNPTAPWNGFGVKPKMWNTGQCPYFGKLHGGWGGFNSHNDQHLPRDFVPALTMMRMWGDECARLDLEMLLQDTFYAYPDGKIPIPVARAGSGFYGHRAPSWISFLRTEMGLASTIARNSGIAQMANCKVLRIPYSNGLGAVPDPYLVSSGVPDPLDHKWNFDQSMEAWIMYHAFISAGMYREARALAASEFLDMSSVSNRKGYVPKFWNTGELRPATRLRAGGDVPTDQVTVGAGVPDYAPPMVMGLEACREMQFGGDPDPWIKSMLRFSTPTMGKATNIADLRTKLRAEVLGRHQIVAALAAAERA